MLSAFQTLCATTGVMNNSCRLERSLSRGSSRARSSGRPRSQARGQRSKGQHAPAREMQFRPAALDMAAIVTEEPAAADIVEEPVVEDKTATSFVTMVFSDAVDEFADDTMIDVEDPEPLDLDEDEDLEDEAKATASLPCSAMSTADTEDIVERNASGLEGFCLPTYDRDEQLSQNEDYEEVFSLCSTDSWEEKELEAARYSHMAVDFTKNAMKRACDLDEEEAEEEEKEEEVQVAEDEQQLSEMEQMRQAFKSTLLSAMRDGRLAQAIKHAATQEVEIEHKVEQSVEEDVSADFVEELLEDSLVDSAKEEPKVVNPLEAIRLEVKQTFLSSFGSGRLSGALNRMDAERKSDSDKLRERLSNRLAEAERVGRVAEVATALKAKNEQKEAEELRQAARQRLSTASASERLASLLGKQAKAADDFRLQARQRLLSKHADDMLVAMLPKVEEVEVKEEVSTLQSDLAMDFITGAVDTAFTWAAEATLDTDDEAELVGEDDALFMHESASSSLAAVLGDALERAATETSLPAAEESAATETSLPAAEESAATETSLPAAEKSAATEPSLPPAKALEACERRQFDHWLKECDVVPVPAKTVAAAEIVKSEPVVLQAPALEADWDVIRAAKLPVEKEQKEPEPEVEAQEPLSPLSPTSRSVLSPPSTPSGSRKLHSSKSKRRIIGGVVREAAPVQAQPEVFVPPATPTRSKRREIVPAISFRMDADDTSSQPSRSRPSSLTRGYDALGCNFYSIQDKEEVSTPTRLSAPQVLNPVVRPPSRSHSSAMMMDLGLDASSSWAATSPLSPSKSFGTSSSSPSLAPATSKRSLSQGTLKVSKSSGGSFLPAIAPAGKGASFSKPMSFQMAPTGTVSWGPSTPSSSKRPGMLGASSSSPLLF
eukprot:TRINITY_DN2100_c0_g1_i1.p1 TRINITY_DN2100_c0_g1~~TRINITY_DN2100_c0_g1_i1.p1  ORF type:complete len:891 (-),score=345.05 TRINITY_DN2100_c0_g1_i1:310-2982(-)